MSTSPRPDPLATFDSLDPTAYAFTRRTWVDAPPARVYHLVGDVSSISRWSPNATDAAYDRDAGPRVGAWFSGHNRKDGREWTTRSQVVRADPAAAFGFVVGGTENGIVQWDWTFRSQGRGTIVRQSWKLLRLDPVLGTTRADLDDLRRYMTDSVEVTLASMAQYFAGDCGTHEMAPGTPG
ncbi:SRPBCC family protein [Streptomyces sp. NPDC005281]|uniref:SRPBCC family protein n=1 Tax=Streptomyces sp. NPDC005281 TaxID=3155712 RepID=UPI0033A57051